MIGKISQTEINKNSMAALPTRPNDRSAYGAGGLSSAELRARMDALALLAIAKCHELVDAIGKSDADGLVSMLPSGIDGKSVKDVLDGIKNGELAGYLAAYDDEAKLKTLQSIITELYERIVEAGDGATFFPYIDEEGNLSWTNDKGHDNPDPINIMGSKLVRTEYVGKDEDGNNLYRQIYSDDSTAELTAPKGEDGTDGLTPYIANGTWWIGDEDTGVPASGGDGGGSVKTAYGSYIGTGEYDMDDEYRTTLSFGFNPMLVVVQMKNPEPSRYEEWDGNIVEDYDHTYIELIAVRGLSRRRCTFKGEFNSYYVNEASFITWEEDCVRIASGYSEGMQWNIAGYEYVYFAIGV